MTSPARLRGSIPPALLALCLLGLAGLGSAAPALAQPPADEPAPAPVAAEADAATDRAIAEGLRRRLAQNDELRDVTVAVEAGVVRLAGTALTPDARDDAEALARRTEGVVDVSNELEVVRDVRERLAPAIADLREQAYDLVGALPVAGFALVVFLAFVFLARLVGRWNRLFRRISHNRFARELAQQAVRGAIVLVGALVALEILGATAVVGAVLGAAGVVGLAIGFAFQDLIENYISGVLLSLRQPFDPNDHVVIDDREGKVIRLTTRATVLMTLDGNHLRLPNAQVFKGVILNYSRNPQRRFDFAIGVGVDVGIAEALALGVETLEATPGVLADPEPWAVVENLGDSTVNLRFFAWIDQRASRFQVVKSEGIRRVKEAFDAAGIDMPEPIYRVTLREAAPAAEAEPAPAAEPAPPRPTPTTPPEEPPAAPTGAGDDAIDRQIAAERTDDPSGDLLSEDAPKE